MLGALLYLRLTSFRNLVIQRVRRLRQPKYLVGTAVAVAYFYFILIHRNGPVGSVGLYFEGEFARYREMERNTDAEPV